MTSHIAASFLLLGAASAAAITPRSGRPNGRCHQFDVDITAEAPGGVYDIPKVTDDITAAYWAVHNDTWSNALIPTKLENTTISGTYKIHAQLCVPKNPNGKDVLQIATHGAAYDSRYWDSTYKPEEHSYVYAALEAGYSILTYDRLGTGQSDIPDPYTGVQTGIQLEILRELTQKARDGALFDAKSWSDSGADDVDVSAVKPSKIVHIGHSLGSILTSAFLAKYPDQTDGGIITGFAINQFLGSAGFASWSPQHAATANPPFDRPNGYIVSAKTGLQNIFFGGNPSTAFTAELLEHGDVIKQPVPVAELEDDQVLSNPDAGFKGPIQYVLPEFDFFVCGGDCKGLTNATVLSQFWQTAADVDFQIQPNTGHGLPFHNNATAGFQLSFDFLSRNGL